MCLFSFSAYTLQTFQWEYIKKSVFKDRFVIICTMYFMLFLGIYAILFQKLSWLHLEQDQRPALVTERGPAGG